MADEAHIHAPGLSQDLTWQDTLREAADSDTWSVTLRTDHGDVEARYHPVPANESICGGVIWVGGARGGLDGPAGGLYPAACRRLQRLGCAGLRIHYRHPNILVECMLDALLGIEFLAREGIQRITLVGHSFGGAVVIGVGALSDKVKAVVPIATQLFGTQNASQVSPRPMLLIHGLEDEILSHQSSRAVFRRANPPKELKLFPGARHGLDEVKEELLELLVLWIPKHLKADQ